MNINSLGGVHSPSIAQLERSEHHYWIKKKGGGNLLFFLL
jgi:hypothetical protein